MPAGYNRTGCHRLGGSRRTSSSIPENFSPRATNPPLRAVTLPCRAGVPDFKYYGQSLITAPATGEKSLQRVLHAVPWSEQQRRWAAAANLSRSQPSRQYRVERYRQVFVQHINYGGAAMKSANMPFEINDQPARRGGRDGLSQGHFKGPLRATVPARDILLECA